MNRTPPPEPPPDPTDRPNSPATRDLPDLAGVRDTVPQPAVPPAGRGEPKEGDRSVPATRRAARRTVAPRPGGARSGRPASGTRHGLPSHEKSEPPEELPYPQAPEGYLQWEFTSLSLSETSISTPEAPAPPLDAPAAHRDGPDPRSTQPGPDEPRPHGADPAGFAAHPPHPQHRLRFSTRRRRLDAPALGQLLLHLPWVLCSALLVGKVSQLALGPLGWLPLLLWMLSGALVFHRPTENLMSRYLLGLRRPSQHDMARLAPAWQEVTGLVGVDGSRYGLWVEDSEELNAFAAGGHVVAVTRRALDVLEPRQLAAVLAHELSHQQEGHAWASLLGSWYGLPARKLWDLLCRLLVSLRHSARSWRYSGPLEDEPYGRYDRRDRQYGRFGRDRLDRRSRPVSGGGLALAVVALALLAWFFITATYGLPLAMLAAPFLLGVAARRSEYRADRYAAGLGYGPPLADVLEVALRDEQERPREHTTVVTRLLSLHPDTADRLHRLRPHLHGH